MYWLQRCNISKLNKSTFTVIANNVFQHKWVVDCVWNSYLKNKTRFPEDLGFVFDCELLVTLPDHIW